MWIETTNRDDDDRPLTRALRVDGYDRVEFSPTSGKAQVTRDHGEHLIEHYAVRETDTDQSTDTGDAAATTADAAEDEPLDVDDDVDDTDESPET